VSRLSPNFLRRCVWALLLPCAFSASAQQGATGGPEDVEVVDLQTDPAAWSLRNVLAPLTSLFVGGPGYWYSEREVLVDTTPSGGTVELFYVRNSFQKVYERAQSPVQVILPPRIEAYGRDTLRIRASAPGYHQRSLSMKVNAVEDAIAIDLDPLPNRLEAVAHRYFAGRASIVLMTEEATSPRLQKQGGGFTIVLEETALGDGVGTALEGISDGLISDVRAQQLGEDLVIRVELRADAVGADVRSRAGYDAARELHLFAVDLVAQSGGRAVADALAALGRLERDDVTGCALVFDAKLRESLDEGSLSRSLAPRGGFTDRYVRAAMRRFGEIAPEGRVEFVDGSVYRPALPIELDAALSQAAGARGFLALLRSFAEELEGDEHAAEAFHSLVAPELDRATFERFRSEAAAAERSCRR